MRLTFLFVLIAALGAQAQTVRIEGKVLDASNQTPLSYATVYWLSAADAVQTGTVSDDKGAFELNLDLSRGRRGTLVASFLGYGEWKRELEVPAGVAEWKLPEAVLLRPDSTTLQEVKIVEQVLPAIQKDDTTQFNANAFKVNPDASAEDLVRKLPGVMDNNGKLQVQGEDVKQVLVDGKPFFGNDPNAALKNLPADVIAKIQVFDQQSMGGFGDGSTTKTINIITKPTMRDGWFGRVFAGYGVSDRFTSALDMHRYKAGGNINYFKGDRRLSIMLQSNNVNEQNFSTEDLLGVVSVNQNASGGRPGGGGGRPSGGGGHGRPGGGYRPGGGGDVSDFLVGDRPGISTTHAFGLNYMDKFGKKKQVDLSANYFFNWTTNRARTETFRQFITPSDSGLVYNELALSGSDNMNHRFNMQLSWRVDSLTSLLFRPRLSVQYNVGASQTDGRFANSEAPLSSTLSDFDSNLLGVSAGNEFLLTRTFRPGTRRRPAPGSDTLAARLPGRMLTWSLNTDYSRNWGDNALTSANRYPLDTLWLTDSLLQQAHLLKNGWSLRSNLTYTAPLSQRSALQFSHAGSYSLNASDKRTYAYDGSDYTLLDTALTNVFASTYHTQGAGISYRYQHKDFFLTASGTYQWSSIDNQKSFPTEGVLRRSFHAFLPSMMIRYSITKTKSWRLFYRSSTNSPSIDQLQNVVNNNNPLQLSAGNPDLNQTFQQSLFTRYSATNTDKNSTFFAMIGGTFTHNYVGNSVLIAREDTTVNGVFLPAGGQFTSPLNFGQGMLWLRTFVSYGMPIKALKTNVSVNASANYSRTPGLINGALNLAHSPVLSAGLSLASNISEKIDFNISTNSSLNFIANSLQRGADSRFFTQNTSLRLNWIFWKNFLIQTEVNHQYNAGMSSSFNTQFVLWNLSVGKKFLKNNAAELRLTVFDLLNQNTQVQRSNTETYIQDQRNIALRRYFMLTFTYNIKHFKEQPTEGDKPGRGGGTEGRNTEGNTAPQREGGRGGERSGERGGGGQ